MGRLTVHRPIVKIVSADDGVGERRRSDTLAVEEPLEIRVGGTPLAITMRTPGDDFALESLVTNDQVCQPRLRSVRRGNQDARAFAERQFGTTGDKQAFGDVYARSR